MAATIVHRGPDGEGCFEQPGISLGHRRLSIIDLAGGAQPLANEDESVWVTFNGEIYNFGALRRELEGKGHQFKTRSDTEVLVHLYEELGTAMFARLRGMFALGLWDARTRSLILARDRLGKKPLVYWHDREGLRFASELKALAADPAFPRDVDPHAIDDYLAYQYVPHPRTIYKAAKKLPPGSVAVYAGGQLKIEPYWTPPYETEDQTLSEADAAAILRERLTEATRLRMIADVPVGAFLSGGIDSTIIVGLMKQVSNDPVKTYSIGFPVRKFDERAFARLAAEHIETEHTEFVVEPDAVEVVEKLAWFYDEPFADSSAVPTYYVSKLCREHVTVALTGDAGDELFAGYPRYRAVWLGEKFDRLPKPLKSLITWSGWQWLPASVEQKSVRRQFKKFLRYLGEPPTARYRQWISIFDDEWRPRMYAPAFAAELAGRRAADWIEELYAALPGRDFITRTTYVDLLSYLPCDLLVKVDIASMANSLECRCPFLDHEVLELAGRLPIHFKMNGTEQKRLLKRAFPDLLPKALRDRPKMGFGVPIDSWFRNELADMVRDLLLGDRFHDRGWFDQAAVNRLVEEHTSATWDHSARLWALMMLELWARNYLDVSSRADL